MAMGALSMPLMIHFTTLSSPIFQGWSTWFVAFSGMGISAFHCVSDSGGSCRWCDNVLKQSYLFQIHQATGDLWWHEPSNDLLRSHSTWRLSTWRCDLPMPCQLVSPLEFWVVQWCWDWMSWMMNYQLALLCTSYVINAFQVALLLIIYNIHIVIKYPFKIMNCTRSD